MVGKETVEHSPVDEMPFVIEVSWVVTEFSGDSSTPQVDEVPGDISIVDEELIGIEASKSMTELSNNNHLQLTGENVLHNGFSMEKQLEAHVEPMEEDVQPSFGLAIYEGQHRDHTLVFQHSLLQRRTDRICNIISSSLHNGLREAELFRHARGDDQVSSTVGSPLPIGERETELPSQISCVDLCRGMRRSELHKAQPLYVAVVLCAGVRAFNPSLGVGWRVMWKISVMFQW